MRRARAASQCITRYALGPKQGGDGLAQPVGAADAEAALAGVAGVGVGFAVGEPALADVAVGEGRDDVGSALSEGCKFAILACFSGFRACSGRFRAPWEGNDGLGGASGHDFGPTEPILLRFRLFWGEKSGKRVGLAGWRCREGLLELGGARPELRSAAGARAGVFRRAAVGVAEAGGADVVEGGEDIAPGVVDGEGGFGGRVVGGEGGGVGLVFGRHARSRLAPFGVAPSPGGWLTAGA